MPNWGAPNWINRSNKENWKNKTFHKLPAESRKKYSKRVNKKTACSKTFVRMLRLFLTWVLWKDYVSECNRLFLFYSFFKCILIYPCLSIIIFIKLMAFLASDVSCFNEMYVSVLIIFFLSLGWDLVDVESRSRTQHRGECEGIPVFDVIRHIIFSAVNKFLV